MSTKTILHTPIRDGTQHVVSFAMQNVNRSIQWLQPSGQAALWTSAMAEVRPTHISAPPYHLDIDELIIQNAKRLKKLVQCGRLGCAARALMPCAVAESSKHTLLSKL
jgi:hypothetical protein